MPRAIGIEDHLAELAQLLPARVELAELRGHELLQALAPAPVGELFLRRLGGEAWDYARLGCHLQAPQPTPSAAALVP